MDSAFWFFYASLKDSKKVGSCKRWEAAGFEAVPGCWGLVSPGAPAPSALRQSLRSLPSPHLTSTWIQRLPPALSAQPQPASPSMSAPPRRVGSSGKARETRRWVSGRSSPRRQHPSRRQGSGRGAASHRAPLRCSGPGHSQVRGRQVPHLRSCPSHLRADGCQVAGERPRAAGDSSVALRLAVLPWSPLLTPV